MTTSQTKAYFKKRVYNIIKDGRIYDWEECGPNIQNYIAQLEPLEGYHVITCSTSIKGQDLLELLQFIDSESKSNSQKLEDKINSLPNWNSDHTTAAITILRLMLYNENERDQETHITYKHHNIMTKVNCLMGKKCPYWHHCNNNFVNELCSGHVRRQLLPSIINNSDKTNDKINAHSAMWNHSMELNDMAKIQQ